MSEQNVEIVRRVYDEWMRGNFTGADVWHPEIEFVVDVPGGVDMENTTVHGIEAMGRRWRTLLEVWEELKSGPIEELFDLGETVVVTNRIVARGRRSGVELTTADRGAVFTFRDGRVVRLLLTNRAEALKLAGQG